MQVSSFISSSSSPEQMISFFFSLSPSPPATDGGKGREGGRRFDHSSRHPLILNLIGIHLDRGKLCHSQLYLENTTRRARNRESSIELVEWADPGLLGSIPLPLPPSDAVIMLQTRKVHFDFLSLSHIIFFRKCCLAPFILARRANFSSSWALLPIFAAAA